MTPLAHGNGIDEAIAILVPLIAVIVLLRIGAKKAPPEDEPEEAEDAADPAAPAEGQQDA